MLLLDGLEVHDGETYNTPKDPTAAERMRRYRAAKAKELDSLRVTHRNVTQAEAEAEEYVKNGVAKATPCPSGRTDSGPEAVEAIWSAYPKRGRERSTRAKTWCCWPTVLAAVA